MSYKFNHKTNAIQLEEVTFSDDLDISDERVS